MGDTLNVTYIGPVEHDFDCELSGDSIIVTYNGPGGHEFEVEISESLTTTTTLPPIVVGSCSSVEVYEPTSETRTDRFNYVDCLLNKLPDNTDNRITAKDIRDAIFSLWRRIDALEVDLKLDFGDTDTIGFTSSGNTYSAFIQSDSITASLLSTVDGGATAGYLLSNDGEGNFKWVEQKDPLFGDTDTIAFTQSGDTFSSFILPDSLTASLLKTVDGFGATAGYLLSNDGEGKFKWIDGIGGGILQYSSTMSFPDIGNTTILYIDLSNNDSYYWNNNYILLDSFLSNEVVSLSDGKSFGKYTTGNIVPSQGKTAKQVIKMALQESINPTVALNSPTIVQFNQTSINNVLNFSHIINTLGANVQSAVLEWRRNNTGSWITLSTSTDSSGTFTHTLTDTPFNPHTFNYRYIVTDSTGASTTTTRNITPVPYANPSITINITGNTISSPETNLNRERGNINSNITGTITRQSAFVNLVSYTIQYRINSTGNWINIPSFTNVPISTPASFTIPASQHNDTSLSNSTSLQYRITVIDTYQQSISSSVEGSPQTINFRYMIFFGPVAGGPPGPSNSNGVRLLPNRIFINGPNPFILETGNVERCFSVAIPQPSNITEVIDLDALNANITANYILSAFTVEDFGGNNVNYNIYTMVNAIAYTSGGTPPGNHRHQITRT